MSATKISSVYEASSKLAKYPFEPYVPFDSAL